MKVWFGFILVMGLVKKINLKLYWLINLVIKILLFIEIMFRDRYFIILRYLYFVNNDNVLVFDDVNRDKLWKIRLFLVSLLLRFIVVYVLL